VVSIGEYLKFTLQFRSVSKSFF